MLNIVTSEAEENISNSVYIFNVSKYVIVNKQERLWKTWIMRISENERSRY